jgi:hypothetical protein
MKAPVLKPIDPRLGIPIWVICDASVSGVGAMYGQGPHWKSCRPAGFMSKKFTSTQHSYAVYEAETLAILEALLKWEDKLLGYRITIVTDHESLEFFKTKKKLSNRQIRWMEYMSRFNFGIIFIQGTYNKVADYLSRYYMTDKEGEHHPIDEYVNADIRLDQEGETWPWGQAAEVESAMLRAHREAEVASRKSKRLQEAAELRTREAAELAVHSKGEEKTVATESRSMGQSEHDPTMIESSTGNAPKLNAIMEKEKIFLISI